MWLGIDAKSVSIYPMANKQKSIKTYQWSELTDMSYRGSNFIIKHTQKMPVGKFDLIPYAYSVYFIHVFFSL